MAAAIILVPEMLSGPPEQKPAEAARPTGETPVKTYTIDLSQSSAQATDDVPDTRAPPGELPAAADGNESNAEGETADRAPRADPESESGETAEQVASTAPPETKAPISAAEAKASVPTPEAKTPTVSNPPGAPAAVPPPVSRESPRTIAADPSPRTPIASGGSAPKSQGSGWAVQLGSFSSQATAERLAAEFRGDGYDALVMPVKSSGTTLYRVRIGASPSREQADATLRKVKGKVPGAAVVKHP